MQCQGKPLGSNKKNVLKLGAKGKTIVPATWFRFSETSSSGPSERKGQRRKEYFEQPVAFCQNRGKGQFSPSFAKFGLCTWHTMFPRIGPIGSTRKDDWSSSYPPPQVVWCDTCLETSWWGGRSDLNCQLQLVQLQKFIPILRRVNIMWNREWPPPWHNAWSSLHIDLKSVWIKDVRSISVLSKMHRHAMESKLMQNSCIHWTSHFSLAAYIPYLLFGIGCGTLQLGKDGK